MAGLCQRCGAPDSPSGAPASCGVCRVSARPVSPGFTSLSSAAWLAARDAAGGTDLAQILHSYRLAAGLTQQQLAGLLGYDRTYVSMIENGRRSVTDRGTLTYIARALAIPPHLLGITADDDVDFASMLAFGGAVIRLAEVARHSGRAAVAVSELWPLISRLEGRIAAGYAEPPAVHLLAQARVSLGVALGHLLPDEKLATAAWWTGKALRLAQDRGDRPLLAWVLQMHGNELRKAGHPAAAVVRLRQALQADDHPARRGAGLVLLARAAAEAGQPDLFDAVCSQCVQALETVSQREEVLFSDFTVREVRLRGLLATGRTDEAVRLAEGHVAGSGPPTPQWRVIERITTAEVLARAGDQRTAESMLSAAVDDAEALRLPHQVQRIIQLTGPAAVLSGSTARRQAIAAVTRLDQQLTGAGPR
jgi:transcriptional regulator with XRE-family HTH domain